MSFGALSAPAKEALGRGASEVGGSTTTGDGGMTPRGARPLENARLPAAAVALRHEPGRPGRADAIEIVVGQGAKPGGGGMLLGQKISDRVAEMRDLPKGIDQRSAWRHPDWTGPDDLEIRSRSCARSPTGRNHLRQGRRDAAVLRHGARREVRRGRGRDGRDAGRHGCDARRSSSSTWASPRSPRSARP